MRAKRSQIQTLRKIQERGGIFSSELTEKRWLELSRQGWIKADFGSGKIVLTQAGEIEAYPTPMIQTTSDDLNRYPDNPSYEVLAPEGYRFEDDLHNKLTYSKKETLEIANELLEKYPDDYDCKQ
jgi:hypothetical protein